MFEKLWSWYWLLFNTQSKIAWLFIISFFLNIFYLCTVLTTMLIEMLCLLIRFICPNILRWCINVFRCQIFYYEHCVVNKICTFTLCYCWCFYLNINFFIFFYFILNFRYQLINWSLCLLFCHLVKFSLINISLKSSVLFHCLNFAQEWTRTWWCYCLWLELKL